MNRVRSLIYRLLRKSESLLKTDMVYLARGGFWVSLPQIVAIAASFLLSIAFANLLPKHEYGVYRYIISIAGLVSVFSLTGLSVAVAQSVAKGFSGAFFQGVKTAFKWSAGMIAISLIGSAYYFSNGNNTLGAGLILVGLLTPVINGLSLYSSFLNGKKDFRLLGTLGVIRNLLYAAAILLTLFLTQNILIIVAVYFGIQAFGMLIGFLVSKHRYKPTAVNDPQMPTYAKHLSLMDILYGLADQMDRIIIFLFFGGVELAIYSFAVAIPTQISGVFRSVNVIALPKFAARDRQSILSAIGLKIRSVLLVTSLIVFAYILVSPIIFRLFFSQYSEAVPLSMLFALSLIPANAASLLSTTFEAHKETRVLYIQRTLSPLLRIFLFIILGYFFGPWGMVIAMILAKTFAFALLWMYTKNHPSNLSQQAS